MKLLEFWTSLVVMTIHLQEAASKRGRAYKRVCYFGSWGMKRSIAEARIKIEQIDADLCTHLIYAFGYIDTNNLDLTGTEWDDESNDNMVGSFEKFNQLKEQNPRLKTLISLGGAKAGSWPFEVISHNRTTTRMFASNAVEFLRKWGFDGIDVDWEFPKDYRKFNSLLKIIREAITEAEGEDGRKYLLSVAVGVSEKHISEGYDIPTISSVADFINLMTYDFHGSWDRFTGGNAPLLPRPRDRRYNHRNNLDWVVQRWLQGGAPKQKLVVGLSAQARTYTLANPLKTGVGAPSIGPGVPGKYTQEQGTMAYFEVCDLMFEKNLKSKWDKVQKFPFISHDNQWISFDNKRSIAIKTQFVIKRQLGGAMIWSLDIDDVTGKSCGEGKFPLTSTMKDMLLGNRMTHQEDLALISGADGQIVINKNYLHKICSFSYLITMFIMYPLILK